MAIFQQEPPLMGASNAGRVGKNHDSQPSGYSTDDWWNVVTTSDHGVKCITADTDDDGHASVNLFMTARLNTVFSTWRVEYTGEM